MIAEMALRNVRSVALPAPDTANSSAGMSM